MPEITTLENPCDSEDLSLEAEEACSVITDPEDSFKQCIKAVNATKFFDICKKDFCAAAKSRVNPDESKLKSLCRSFETMAYQCSEHFMNIEWRRIDRCRKKKNQYFFFC